MERYENILLAVDLAGELDEPIARAVARVGHGATLSVVHVLEPAYFYYGIEPAIGTLPPNFEAELLERAKSQLAAIAARYGVPSERQYLERGHAPTQILRLAKDKGVDLVILGSHGRHGWRLLLGSTANAVLHHAECDVLAVRMAGP
ncbi:MAG TPA: universal stress protein [Pseudomonadales bacterium]|nr:universal stress protein [Pseudomonadales bacterium]